jgi:hypothetical protein
LRIAFRAAADDSFVQRMTIAIMHTECYLSGKRRSNGSVIQGVFVKIFVALFLLLNISTAQAHSVCQYLHDENSCKEAAANGCAWRSDSSESGGTCIYQKGMIDSRSNLSTGSDVIDGVVCKFERFDHSRRTVGVSPHEGDLGLAYAYNACNTIEHPCQVQWTHAPIRQAADGRWIRVHTVITEADRIAGTPGIRCDWECVKKRYSWCPPQKLNCYGGLCSCGLGKD